MKLTAALTHVLCPLLALTYLYYHITLTLTVGRLWQAHNLKETIHSICCFHTALAGTLQQYEHKATEQRCEYQHLQ